MMRLGVRLAAYAPQPTSCRTCGRGQAGSVRRPDGGLDLSGPVGAIGGSCRQVEPVADGGRTTLSYKPTHRRERKAGVARGLADGGPVLLVGPASVWMLTEARGAIVARVGVEGLRQRGRISGPQLGWAGIMGMGTRSPHKGDNHEQANHGQVDSWGIAVGFRGRVDRVQFVGQFDVRIQEPAHPSASPFQPAPERAPQHGLAEDVR